jgi:hypothetical protein
MTVLHERVLVVRGALANPGFDGGDDFGGPLAPVCDSDGFEASEQQVRVAVAVVESFGITYRRLGLRSVV